MRLIMVLGPCNGEVINSTEQTASKTIGLVMEKDPELGKLHIRYRLFAMDPQEAYYVPETLSNLQIIKQLAEK